MDCMICTEDLLSQPVGELDCCEHRYATRCSVFCIALRLLGYCQLLSTECITYTLFMS